MYIHLYMTQAHEYAMVGLGACRDPTGNYGKDAFYTNNYGAYTLAECKFQCDAVPNCQGFAVQTAVVTKEWCQLWSGGKQTADGRSAYQCWSKKVATALRLLFWNRLC